MKKDFIKYEEINTNLPVPPPPRQFKAKKQFAQPYSTKPYTRPVKTTSALFALFLGSIIVALMAFLSLGQKPNNIKPKTNINNEYIDRPNDGTKPIDETDHLKNILIAAKVFRDQSHFQSETNGQATAYFGSFGSTTQKIKAMRQYDTVHLANKQYSKGAFASPGLYIFRNESPRGAQYFVKELAHLENGDFDKPVWRQYKGSDAPFTEADFTENILGSDLKDFTQQILSRKTIKKVELINQTNGETTYRVDFVVDDDLNKPSGLGKLAATGKYAVEVREMTQTPYYPTFKSFTLEVTMNDRWEVLKTISNEEYNLTVKGISSDFAATMTQTFTYKKEKVQTEDFHNFFHKDFRKHGENAEPKPDATDLLIDAFSKVKSGNFTGSLNVNGQVLEFTATFSKDPAFLKIESRLFNLHYENKKYTFSMLGQTYTGEADTIVELLGKLFNKGSFLNLPNLQEIIGELNQNFAKPKNIGAYTVLETKAKGITLTFYINKDTKELVEFNAKQETNGKTLELNFKRGEKPANPEFPEDKTDFDNATQQLKKIFSDTFEFNLSKEINANSSLTVNALVSFNNKTSISANGELSLTAFGKNYNIPFDIVENKLTMHFKARSLTFDLNKIFKEFFNVDLTKNSLEELINLIDFTNLVKTAERLFSFLDLKLAKDNLKVEDGRIAFDQSKTAFALTHRPGTKLPSPKTPVNELDLTDFLLKYFKDPDANPRGTISFTLNYDLNSITKTDTDSEIKVAIDLFKGKISISIPKLGRIYIDNRGVYVEFGPNKRKNVQYFAHADLKELAPQIRAALSKYLPGGFDLNEMISQILANLTVDQTSGNLSTSFKSKDDRFTMTLNSYQNETPYLASPEDQNGKQINRFSKPALEKLLKVLESGKFQASVSFADFTIQLNLLYKDNTLYLNAKITKAGQLLADISIIGNQVYAKVSGYNLKANIKDFSELMHKVFEMSRLKGEIGGFNLNNFGIDLSELNLDFANPFATLQSIAKTIEKMPLVKSLIKSLEFELNYPTTDAAKLLTFKLTAFNFNITGYLDADPQFNANIFDINENDYIDLPLADLNSKTEVEPGAKLPLDISEINKIKERVMTKPHSVTGSAEINGVQLTIHRGYVSVNSNFQDVEAVLYAEAKFKDLVYSFELYFAKNIVYLKSAKLNAKVSIEEIGSLIAKITELIKSQGEINFNNFQLQNNLNSNIQALISKFVIQSLTIAKEEITLAAKYAEYEGKIYFNRRTKAINLTISNFNLHLTLTPTEFSEVGERAADKITELMKNSNVLTASDILKIAELYSTRYSLEDVNYSLPKELAEKYLGKAAKLDLSVKNAQVDLTSKHLLKADLGVKFTHPQLGSPINLNFELHIQDKQIYLLSKEYPTLNLKVAYSEISAIIAAIQKAIEKASGISISRASLKNSSQTYLTPKLEFTKILDALNISRDGLDFDLKKAFGIEQITNVSLRFKFQEKALSLSASPLNLNLTLKKTEKKLNLYQPSATTQFLSHEFFEKTADLVSTGYLVNGEFNYPVNGENLKVEIKGALNFARKTILDLELKLIYKDIQQTFRLLYDKEFFYLQNEKVNLKLSLQDIQALISEGQKLKDMFSGITVGLTQDLIKAVIAGTFEFSQTSIVAKFTEGILKNLEVKADLTAKSLKVKYVSMLDITLTKQEGIETKDVPDGIEWLDRSFVDKVFDMFSATYELKATTTDNAKFKGELSGNVDLKSKVNFAGSGKVEFKIGEKSYFLELNNLYISERTLYALTQKLNLKIPFAEISRLQTEIQKIFADLKPLLGLSSKADLIKYLSVYTDLIGALTFTKDKITLSNFTISGIKLSAEINLTKKEIRLTLPDLGLNATLTKSTKQNTGVVPAVQYADTETILNLLKLYAQTYEIDGKAQSGEMGADFSGKLSLKGEVLAKLETYLKFKDKYLKATVYYDKKYLYFETEKLKFKLSVEELTEIIKTAPDLLKLANAENIFNLLTQFSLTNSELNVGYGDLNVHANFLDRKADITYKNLVQATIAPTATEDLGSVPAHEWKTYQDILDLFANVEKIKSMLKAPQKTFNFAGTFELNGKTLEVSKGSLTINSKGNTFDLDVIFEAKYDGKDYKGRITFLNGYIYLDVNGLRVKISQEEFIRSGYRLIGTFGGSAEALEKALKYFNNPENLKEILGLNLASRLTYLNSPIFSRFQRGLTKPENATDLFEILTEIDFTKTNVHASVNYGDISGTFDLEFTDIRFAKLQIANAQLKENKIQQAVFEQIDYTEITAPNEADFVDKEFKHFDTFVDAVMNTIDKKQYHIKGQITSNKVFGIGIAIKNVDLKLNFASQTGTEVELTFDMEHTGRDVPFQGRQQVNKGKNSVHFYMKNGRGYLRTKTREVTGFTGFFDPKPKFGPEVTKYYEFTEAEMKANLFAYILTMIYADEQLWNGQTKPTPVRRLNRPKLVKRGPLDNLDIAKLIKKIVVGKTESSNSYDYEFTIDKDIVKGKLPAPLTMSDIVVKLITMPEGDKQYLRKLKINTTLFAVLSFRIVAEFEMVAMGTDVPPINLPDNINDKW